MALQGAASLRGVPDLGLPKVNSLVGGTFILGLFRFAAVVDDREEHHALSLKTSVNHSTVSSTE
jgi:hypothetical protein